MSLLLGAIIGAGSVIESNVIVAAGSVVSPGTMIKSGQLWAGNPAVYVRDLTPEEKTFEKVRLKSFLCLISMLMLLIES
jgi:carbonic anhydrase/acetyltransferase-like protein (isoleucine patch superfamily)